MATIAVIGAGSLQGRELLSELESRQGVDRLLPLSEKAAGTEVPFRGGDLVVEELDQDALAEKPDVVFFTSGAARSLRWAQRFVAAGSRVVDLSSAYRLDPSVPLLGLAGPSSGRLMAIPSAASLAAARVLGPLFAKGGTDGARLNATLLAPVSAAGQAGVLELSKQTAALLAGRSAKSRTFSHRIAFNLVPEVGEPGGAATGDTSQEQAFRAELRRLWSLPDLAVSVTAVRAPVFFGLSMVLSGSNGDPKAPVALNKAVARGPEGIKLLDESGAFPMPLLTVGDSSVLVGRIRSDEAGGFQLFATVDALKLVAECAVSAGLGGVH
jgi:aspartate-semialdehyde dehydrogenase